VICRLRAAALLPGMAGGQSRFRFASRKAGLAYPVHDGIAIMLPKEARESVELCRHEMQRH
jgi:hypothetical protein